MNQFVETYRNLLNGVYWRFDRIVISGYFRLLNSPGGEDERKHELAQAHLKNFEKEDGINLETLCIEYGLKPRA